MVFDAKFSRPIPSGLTSFNEKEELYPADTYFWEGWEDWYDIFGDASSAKIFDYSLIVLKPDVIAARKMRQVRDWLGKNGFIITHCSRISVSRHEANALWQYQWNAAPRARKEALTLLLSASDSLLLIVRSVQDRNKAATHRFTFLKGSADPKLQKPGDLRALLEVRTHLISFIHSADDPADLLREAAILLPPQERRRAFLNILNGTEVTEENFEREISSLYAAVPENSLDFFESLQKILASVYSQLSQSTSTSNELMGYLESVFLTDQGNWRKLFSWLDQRNIKCEQWDKIVMAAYLSDVSYDHLVPLVPGISPRAVEGFRRPT